MSLICQHCGVRRASRPRGLCWTCFGDEGVRVRYPVSSHGGASRGIRDPAFHAHAPETPTRHPPGSEGKILVLMERCRAGESLWHPDDFSISDELHRRANRLYKDAKE